MGEGNVDEHGNREHWGSRLAFYFTAIGAAVGFGNVWRFPALSVEYGGGAFFIPYLLALFLIGLPILILEIGFGQFFQTGDVNVFGGFHPRLRGVGVASVACGYMLVIYYSMLIAWVVNAFFDSFGDADPWANDDLNGTVAVTYFTDVIIGGETVQDGRATRIVGKNVGYCFLVWVIVFFGTGFGVKWTGRITYFTMGIPIILLFVFLGKAVSLPGAQDGIYEYIGRWDMSILTTQGDVWSTAVSQIFFSLGVTFGMMTAFGSYCAKGEPLTINSCVIAFSNSMFSFISGFAVFGALGYLSYLSGTPVVDLPFSGFSLVFGTWPVVLATLPGGEHWVRLLFFNLFLLGIDSAFAFVEAIITVFLDTKYFVRTPKWKMSLGFCFSGWILSLMYATDAGLSWLDVIDYYINFVMLLVGFFECFAAGWVYGVNRTIENCGKAAFFLHMIANFGAIFVACGLWFGLSKEQGGVWGGFLALFVWYFTFMGIACFFMAKKMKEQPDKWTWPQMLWELMFANIFALRDRIQPVVRWVPSTWCILIKQFIPHVLLVLFILLAQSRTEDGQGDPIFGGYGGYDTKPYQLLGILTFALTLFLFLIGMAFPQVYYPLALPKGHPSLDPDESFVEKQQSTITDPTGQLQEVEQSEENEAALEKA